MIRHSALLLEYVELEGIDADGGLEGACCALLGEVSACVDARGGRWDGGWE